MTVIASILFISALITAGFVISITLSEAMPRIIDVIEAEFTPEAQTGRRINFGPVRRLPAVCPADVVTFPTMSWVETEFKLAA